MQIKKNVITEKKEYPVKVLRILLRLFLIVLGITIPIATIVLIRGQIIAVRKYSVPSGGTEKVRIVALTDLHGKMHGKNQARIVRSIEKQNPDIIVYLGDMVERSKPEQSEEALVVLTDRLSELAPIYYVDGNHEQDVRGSYPEIYEELNSKLVAAGAIHLKNETQQIVLDDDSVVNLCGITTHYHWEEKENEVVAELREREGVKVLLCHYPESVLWYRAFEDGGLDLALCGHTHGGLVRVPFKGGMYAPEWGWWPAYDLGDYPIYSDTYWRHYGGKEGAEYWGTMIISGGLAGEHGVPRVNNPMEISVIDVG